VQQCMQREAEMRTTLLTQVAKKLSELHRAQGWHGNAMLRNFTWHNGQIGMIDFEDTAHASWPLSMRQAYDIWQVLYSAARVENGEALVRHFLAQYEPSSRALGLLRGVAWLQSPLYLLLWPIQSRLKRDIRQGVIAIGALLTHRT
jgi:aminoglycoside/choline kinase family phosphotransferase